MVENDSAGNRGGLAARVITLGDLVDYQDGAVVSREIVRSDAGTVTVFSFDEGQGLSEHTAPFDALVTLVDGAARVTISGKPFGLLEGDSIIMPANEPHSLDAVERFKMVLTLIKA